MVNFDINSNWIHSKSLLVSNVIYNIIDVKIHILFQLAINLSRNRSIKAFVNLTWREQCWEIMEMLFFGSISVMEFLLGSRPHFVHHAFLDSSSVVAFVRKLNKSSRWISCFLETKHTGWTLTTVLKMIPYGKSRVLEPISQEYVAP